jgi:tetratricopeptide (TPR) repeat protein
MIAILLLFSVALGFAQPTELLKKANDQYAANKYAEAISIYESILGQGYVSGAVYFNLGNAYYKNGENSRAILNYERAKLLMPNDDDVKFNLELVNQFVVDNIEPLPRPFFVKWGQSMVNSHSSNGWAAYSLIAFVLMLAGAAGYFFFSSTGLKKVAFTVGIVMLVVSFSTYGCAKKQQTLLTRHNTAIVFAPTVTVKSSPNESGTNLFVLHEGVKVEIKEELNGWANIKLLDGNSGWIKKEVLEKI